MKKKHVKKICIVHFFNISVYNYVRFKQNAISDAAARSGSHARGGQVHVGLPYFFLLPTLKAPE